jgi:hypothetical protein
MNTGLMLFLVLIINIFSFSSTAWSHVLQWVGTGLNGDNAVSSVAADPVDPLTIYAVVTGGGDKTPGIYKSTDGGSNWGLVLSGNPGGPLAINPSDPQVVYAGAYSGVYVSTDGGADWNLMTQGITGGAAVLAVNPSNAQILYAANSSGIYMTTDGGSNWSASGLSGVTVTSFAIDPITPETIYAGGKGGVFESTDGGANWNSLASSLGQGASSVSCLAINPVNPKIIYAGEDNGAISMSTDGGANWVTILSLNSDPSEDYNVTSLVINPAYPQFIYGAVNYFGQGTGAMIGSPDGGASWLQSGGIPLGGMIQSFAISPAAPDVLYAGLFESEFDASGVYMLTSAGPSAPDPPTGVTADVYNTSAVVGFQAPSGCWSDGGSPITSYTVTSSPDGITASGKSSPITLTGLSEGAAYTFTVTATNSEGPSLPSAKSVAGVPVFLPAQSSGTQGAAVLIPVSVGPVTSLLGVSFSVQFDPTVLTATGATVGTLTGGWEIVYNTSTPGTITVALMSTNTSVTGQGQIVELAFNVIGGGNTSTSLTLQNVKLNDGAISGGPQSGEFTVTPSASYSISGNVDYFSNGDPVEGTSLTLGGSSQTQTQTSDVKGNFDFPTVPYSGNYTITPSKADNTGGAVSSFIGALDASLVLQAVVGGISLSPQQMIAADVNNDGNIGVMDAYDILQLIVGNISLPFPGQNGSTWAFYPNNLKFTDLNSNQSNQKFSAILIGDVDGEWSPSETAATGRASAGPARSLQDKNYYADNPDLSLPEASGKPGSTLQVPVTLGAANGVLAASFTVTFDPNVLTATGVSPGTLSSGWLIVSNVKNPGEVRVALAGSNTVNGPGQLALLNFTVKGTAGSSTALTFSNPLLNNGKVPVIPANGSFTVPTHPTVDTPTFTSITTTGATLGAKIESSGGETVSDSGVYYGTGVNPSVSGGIKVGASPLVTSGTFSVTVPGLSSNTVYHFQGYATNPAGTGYSDDTTFTTAAGAPRATAATALSASGFTANWTAPTGTGKITGYQLDVATDSGFSSMAPGHSNLPVSGTSKAVTGLSPGKPYYYRVRAQNAGGVGTNSNTITVSTYALPSVDKPTVSSITTTGAKIGATIEAAGSFAVTYAGVACGTSENPTTSNAKTGATTATSGAFTVNVSGLTPNTLYHFRGYAVSSAGKGYSADATFTTAAGAPTAVAATALSASGFTANWTAPTGTGKITGYQLDVATDPGFSSMAPGYARLPVSGTSKAVMGLSPGKSYYYRVRAVNAAGISSNSNIISVHYTPISITSPNGGETWTAGARHNIAWSFRGDPGPKVRIDLLKAGAVFQTIVSSTSIGSGGIGYYAWTIPSNFPSLSDYRVRVTSTSNAGFSATSKSTFTITRVKTSAGPDQKTGGPGSVTLSGANSTGVRGAVSYRWTQLDGPKVTISNPSAVETTFGPPQTGLEGKSLMFLLSITDSGGAQSSDTCIVNVVRDNAPPTADAGPDRTVAGFQIVELDGSGSSAHDGGALSYLWRQVSGVPVVLSDCSVERPTFVAPDPEASGESMVFELTVKDAAGLRSRDTCIVNVVSVGLPPLANAGSSRTVKPGSRVVLDGSGSRSETGEKLTFSWRQTAGRPVTLSNPAAIKPQFVAPAAGMSEALVFELTVTDSEGLQNIARMTVTVEPN